VLVEEAGAGRIGLYFSQVVHLPAQGQTSLQAPGAQLRVKVLLKVLDGDLEFGGYLFVGATEFGQLVDAGFALLVAEGIVAVCALFAGHRVATGQRPAWLTAQACVMPRARRPPQALAWMTRSSM